MDQNRGPSSPTVPRAEENAKAKWADVQAAFQERANLVPNLAEVAEGSAERERGILTGFHAEADLAAIGRGLQAVIAVRVRQPTRAVIEAFQALKISSRRPA